MAEAEDAIATLWRMLEEYQMPTPKLDARLVGGLVEISVRFSMDQDVNLLRDIESRLALASADSGSA